MPSMGLISWVQSHAATALLCLLSLAGVTHIAAQGTPASEYYVVRSTQFYGDASNYGGPADGGWGTPMFGLTIGGCGYGDISQTWKYPRRAAAAFDPYAQAIAGLPNFGCGTCWKITNPVGNWPAIIVMITDICPECNAKHKTPNGIDIDFFTWKGLLNNKDKEWNAGLLNVVIEQVNCQPQASLQLVITDFTGGWNWIRLRPERVAGLGSIKVVGVHCPNVQLNSATWVPLDNTWGVVFEAKANKFPLYVPGSACRIWITAADGQVLGSPWFDPNWYLYKGGNIDMGWNMEGVVYDKGLGGAPRWPYKEQYGRKLREGEAPVNASHIIVDEHGNKWRTKPQQPTDMPQELKDYLRSEGMLHVDEA